MSTPVSLSVAELIHVLREEVADCTQLGIRLKIQYATLKELERQSMARKPVMDCFTEMCDHWLTNTPKKNKTWSVVYKAIGQQGNNRLVKELKAKGYREDREVDLTLEDFMKELDRMASEWDLLGGALGIPREDTKRIQDSNGLRRYMNAMLEIWLDTGKATWEQLQKALIEVGNRRLSEKIEVDRKKDLEEQQKKKTDSETNSMETDSMQADSMETDPMEMDSMQADSCDKYMCQVFHQRSKNVIQATFVIIPSNKLDELKDQEGTKGPCCSFDIETDKLGIAPTAQEGWCTKVTQKEVSKSSIDKYTGEGKPPSCKLRITPASSQSTPPNLAMNVELEGSKPAQTMKLEQQAENVSTQAPLTTSSSTRTRAQ